MERYERRALQRLERGLPGRWYHDPAHYARELDAFWYREWIAVARTEELASPGD
jgi:Rieske 2Fe-2S family protein